MLDISSEYVKTSVKPCEQTQRYFIQKSTDTNNTTVFAVYLVSTVQAKPEIQGYIQRYRALNGYRYHVSRHDDGHIFASKLKIALGFIKDRAGHLDGQTHL